jgi:hypothetical protein
MSPHRLFLLIFAASVPITATTLLKDTGELTGMFGILGIMGSVIIALLVATRKYWNGARRIS